MISLITGLPGQGKTYYLAKLAKEAIKAKRPLWVNFHLNTTSDLVHYYNDPAMLGDVESGLIIMDEAQIYFNSRNWEAMPERVQYKLQQHRKDGLDIIGAVQNEARVDVVFRELVAEWKHCKKIFSSLENARFPWGLIILSKFDPTMMKEGKPRRAGLPEFVRIKKEITQFYDTLQKIPLPNAGDWKPAHFRICLDCGKTSYKRY